MVAEGLFVVHSASEAGTGLAASSWGSRPRPVRTRETSWRRTDSRAGTPSDGRSATTSGCSGSWVPSNRPETRRVVDRRSSSSWLHRRCSCSKPLVARRLARRQLPVEIGQIRRDEVRTAGNASQPIAESSVPVRYPSVGHPARARRRVRLPRRRPRLHEGRMGRSLRRQALPAHLPTARRLIVVLSRKPSRDALTTRPEERRTTNDPEQPLVGMTTGLGCGSTPISKTPATDALDHRPRASQARHEPLEARRTVVPPESPDNEASPRGRFRVPWFRRVR